MSLFTDMAAEAIAKKDARIAELEKALRYLREEIEGDGNPGWRTLVDRIDSVL
jgi:predicted secreted protein